MAWPNKGSWRGVPFSTKQIDDSGGARNVIHRYPGKATQDAESMGVHAKRFSFDAITIIGDYAAARRELEDALSEEGSGTLIHPIYGKRTCVLAEPYRCVESTTEIGKATFSLVFEEVDEQPAREFSLDTLAVVSGLSVAVSDSFFQPDKYDPSGPNFLQQAVADLLAGPNSVIGTLSRINNQIDAQLNLIDDISGAIDNFTDQLTELINSPQELFIKLAGLQNSVLRALGAAGFDTARNRGDLVNNAARARLAVRSVNALGKVGDNFAPVAGTTAVRRKQRANQEFITDFVEAHAVAATVASLAEIQIDNRSQAENVLDIVSANFDRIMERGTINDAQDQALRKLKAAYSLHLRRRTVTAKGLGQYTPKRTMPSLALAYHLYGDSRREQEMIDINQIDHPLFVPGDVELSVAHV